MLVFYKYKKLKNGLRLAFYALDVEIGFNSLMHYHSFITHIYS